MTPVSGVQADLFGEPAVAGLHILRGYALAHVSSLLEAIAAVTAEAKPRRMIVPGGGTMSVAMSNCGAMGWISDRDGYRYAPDDPLTGHPWPAMPAVIRDLAITAAAETGFPGFDPDACLINHYEPGARMGLHQDRDEGDRTAPIISVSLGLSATFLFGGLKRADPVHKIALHHGDVVVWGGPSRLAYHGVTPLKEGLHADTGRQRINLTLRRAK